MLIRCGSSNMKTRRRGDLLEAYKTVTGNKAIWVRKLYETSTETN